MNVSHLEKCIRDALSKIEGVTEFPSIQIEPTKNKAHGDFACNIALVLAKSLQKKPREIAEKILQHLSTSAYLAKIEIAGPGFINFFLTDYAWYSVITDILTQKDHYGSTDIGKGKRIIVEFLSSNPTGPLHVGHGRHAAFGAVLANLLKITGFSVHCEYYVNDDGRQMDILAVSVWLRYLEKCGEKLSFPSNAYQGDYIIRIADQLQKKQARDFYCAASTLFSDLPKDEIDGGDKEIYIDAIITRAKNNLKEKYAILFDFSLKNVLADIQDDLAEFGVRFDEWFSERTFTKTTAVDCNMTALQTAGLLYEKEGALWFRSTDFGDEKDRVMQRSNDQRTYFANDLAYHINKFTRGFDEAIDIFGADHHGYIPRMKAGLMARQIPPEKLNYLLLQFVALYRNGIKLPMSTRSGSFVTLRELRAEVGNDAARFFYVNAKYTQHVDFDLDLAKSKSHENPVFYIQYAHARICSVFRQLAEKKWAYQEIKNPEHFRVLHQTHEMHLLNTLSRYPDVIQNAASQHEPHLLTYYLRELANDFHGYYNAHPFLVEDETLRNARLTLITVTRQVLANGLQLLGISTPDSM